MEKKKNKAKLITTMVLSILTIISIVITYVKTGQVNTDKIEEAVETAIEGIETYQMSDAEIEDLPTTEIIEQTQEQENAIEQEVESESFEEQGEIAYEGDRARTWNVELGDYKGLTYYSQLDSRWASLPYTSTGNSSQTIGSSGCAPTTASMVVTAIKGAITPDKMSKLFADNGYRSANNGTYLSAFRAVADEFDIGYEETYSVDRAVELLRNNHYVACSCANGLFTTGGHLILIYGIDGDTLKIYDPYLYSGKFETSTRRGKVTVNGNTVYCSISNFRRYANATRFFAYAHNGNVPTNNQPVVTNSYTRYVNAKSGLNVRNSANGKRIGGLANKTMVTVVGTSGNWSHISSPVNGWVSSIYLSSYSQVTNLVVSKNKGYTTGTYQVTAGLINVRTGAGLKYRAKKYYELTSNARTQNKRLGNSKANGLRKGVITTVTKVSGSWGKTPSGWICLDYCKKI